jgi:hypothetical protein
VGATQPHDLFRFCAYFLLSLIAATLKLRLPGITGTMSIGFVFVLLGISELTLLETMLIACTGVVVQCLWRTETRPAPVQVLFSLSAVAVSLVLAYQCTRFVRTQIQAEPVAIVLAVATVLYYAGNSLLVSGVLALVKREPLRAVWQKCYLWSFPYYLVGGLIAGLMAISGRAYGWQPALLLMPAMGMIFLFYRLCLTQVDVQPAQTTAPALHAVKSKAS